MIFAGAEVVCNGPLAGSALVLGDSVSFRKPDASAFRLIGGHRLDIRAGGWDSLGTSQRHQLARFQNRIVR